MTVIVLTKKNVTAAFTPASAKELTRRLQPSDPGGASSTTQEDSVAVTATLVADPDGTSLEDMPPLRPEGPLTAPQPMQVDAGGGGGAPSTQLMQVEPGPGAGGAGGGANDSSDSDDAAMLAPIASPRRGEGGAGPSGSHGGPAVDATQRRPAGAGPSTGNKRPARGEADRPSVADLERRLAALGLEMKREREAREAAEAAAVVATDSLCAAAKRGDHEAVRRLLAAGRDPVDAPDAGGETPLFYAASRGYTEVVGALLDGQADPTIVIEEVTPLLNAIFVGHLGVVRTLLSSYPALATAPVRGTTPLFVAVEGRDAPGAVEILQLLLDCGVDVNAPDRNGHSALRRACDDQRLDTMRRLLQLGAAPTPEVLGRVVANWGEREQMEAAVDALVRHRADPNATIGSRSRLRPLHVAARVGRFFAARALLNARADPTARDRSGLCAREMIGAQMKPGEELSALHRAGLTELLPPDSERDAIIAYTDALEVGADFSLWFQPPSEGILYWRASSDPLQQPHRAPLHRMLADAAAQPPCARYVLQQLQIKRRTAPAWNAEDGAALRSIAKADGFDFFGPTCGVLDAQVLRETGAQRGTLPDGPYERKLLVGAAEHVPWKEKLVDHYLLTRLYRREWYESHPEVFGDASFTLMLLEAGHVAVALTAELGCTVRNAPVVYICLMAKQAGALVTDHPHRVLPRKPRAKPPKACSLCGQSGVAFKSLANGNKNFSVDWYCCQDCYDRTRVPSPAAPMDVDGDADERLWATQWMLDELVRLTRTILHTRCRRLDVDGYIIAQSVGYTHSDGAPVVQTREEEDPGGRFWFSALDDIVAAHEYVFLAAQLCARPGFAEKGCAFRARRVARGD